MKTWSLESAFVRAYTVGAVAVQGVLDALTRRPGHDYDLPLVGCPNPSDCREYSCAGDCSEATEEPLADWEKELLAGATGDRLRSPGEILDNFIADDETPNPTEPGLTDDELVAVRGLLEERYGAAIAAADDAAWDDRDGGRCVFCGATKEYTALTGACVGPLCPHKYFAGAAASLADGEDSPPPGAWGLASVTPSVREDKQQTPADPQPQSVPASSAAATGGEEVRDEPPRSPSSPRPAWTDLAEAMTEHKWAARPALAGWERELIDPTYASIMSTLEAHRVSHFEPLDAWDCPCGERFYFEKDWRYHLGEKIADALVGQK